ncbi:MAG: hypothetical protein AB7T31_15060 [Gemmatimonadales bacterium]
MANGLWTPPIAMDTGPAPGTGYDSDSWWKGPIDDLLEGASDRLRSELGIRDELPELEFEERPRFASIGGSSNTIAMLAIVAIGAGLLMRPRGRRRR